MRHAGAPGALAEQRDELLEEERVAAAAVEHELAQVVGDVGGEVVEQRGGRLAVERVEVEHELVVATDRRRPALEQRRAGGRQQHEREAGRALGEGVGQGEDGVVGPVEVGEEDDDGPLLGPALRGS